MCTPFGQDINLSQVFTPNPLLSAKQRCIWSHFYSLWCDLVGDQTPNIPSQGGHSRSIQTGQMCALCSLPVYTYLPLLSHRWPPPSLFSETPGATAASDVCGHVAGGGAAAFGALWEAGGLCVFGHRDSSRTTD